MKPAPALLIIALATGSASAQEAPFTDSVLLTAEPCFSAPDAGSPSSVITTCTTAEENLGKLILAKVSPDANDLAVYRTMMAIVETTLGTAQAQVDGVRSQRSCNTMERAWLSAAYIDPSASPDHAGEMTEVRGNVARAVRQCRSEFTTPFGAPALPPG